MIRTDGLQTLLLGNAHNMLIARGFVELTTVQEYGVPKVFHHDAELADLLCVGTGRKIFSGVRVRKTHDMKSHRFSFDTARTTLSTQE